MEVLSVQIFASLFEGILIYYWVRAFSKEKKIPLIKGILEIILVSGWILVSWRFFRNPIVMITFTALGCIVLFYVNKVLLKTAVTAAFVFCVIMALCDVLASYIIMFLGRTSLENTRLIPGYMLAANIITKFLILIFVSFVYVGGPKGSGGLSLKKSIYILVLPVASIVILYQLTTYTEMEKGLDAFLCILGICGLFAANIYAFTFFEKEERLEKQRLEEAFLKQQIENERRYYRSLETSSEEIRKMRHDLKNTLTALYGYLEEGRVETAIAFIQKSSAQAAARTSVTGYSALDALIYAKGERARGLKTVFETQIALPPGLSVDEMDLCIILGNALDNALEASEKLPPKQRRVLLQMKAFGGMLMVKVTNSTFEKQIETLQTCKKDKRNHGLGLKTIRDLTEKYDGIVQIESQNYQFRLILNLNL
ncbi:MAG: GHKL domain-containing protein [Eubacterium sp.]|nr:GHKL domain-containing protein [Eubacterium sp.]